MPVKDRNPFNPSDEVPGAADAGTTDPFERPQAVVRCPVCGESVPEKIATHNTPSQILRRCTTCGNQWSCGTIGGAYMTPITEEMMRQQHAEEPDIPDDIRMSGTELWFGDE